MQEVYLKIHNNKYGDRIVSNGKASSGYMYLILRDMLYLYYRDKNKVIKQELKDFNTEDSSIYDNKKEEAYLNICENIDKEIDTWHWYDKEVFKIYRMHWRDKDTLNRLLDEFNGKVSIRKIAKRTSISWTTLFYELKQSKSKIKEMFSEDWEDYKNGDYHLINKNK